MHYALAHLPEHKEINSRSSSDRSLCVLEGGKVFQIALLCTLLSQCSGAWLESCVILSSVLTYYNHMPWKILDNFPCFSFLLQQAQASVNQSLIWTDTQFSTKHIFHFLLDLNLCGKKTQYTFLLRTFSINQAEATVRAALEIGQIVFSDSLRVIVRLAFYQQISSGARAAQLPAFTYPLFYQNKRHGSSIPASAWRKTWICPTSC